MNENLKKSGRTGEFDFIRKISPGCVVRPNGIVKAIGDDAAAFRTDTEKLTLVTTDLLVERIHFQRETISGFALGYKSLAVNLSDIAAMGGTAREAFVSLGIPKACPMKYIDAFYKGMKELARAFQVNLLGGDTSRSRADLIVNVVVTGEVVEEEMLCRDAALPVDLIYTTGFLGDSRAGLHLLSNQIPAKSKAFKALLDAHCFPKAYLAEGRFLARKNGVHAAIDVSDGLSSDMGHIVEESNVGIRLEYDRIPISPGLSEFCERFGFDSRDYAITGGEDYVLLFTVSPETAYLLEEDYRKTFDSPLFRIGTTNDSGRLELIFPDQKVREIKPSGWDHFQQNP